MRVTLIAILLLTLALPYASAAETAVISVPEAGNHYYWFTFTDVKGNPTTTTPVGFDDKKTTVDLPLVKDEVPDCALYVLNAATGNEALLEIKAKPEKQVKFELKADDFDRLRRVDLGIVSSSTGLPASAAAVTLESGDESLGRQILDPSAGGIVRFMDVPAGTVKVSVEYGEGKTASQDIEISLERDEIVPMIRVPIVGKIETIQSAEAETSAPTDSSSGGIPVNVPMALVGLVLLVGIVWLAAATMRGRGLGFRSMLKKVGVVLPDEPQPAGGAQPSPAPVVDPGVCQFCGTRKDPVTGACACSISSGAAAVQSPSAGPRLVATQGLHAGSIFSLGGENVIIGREESNDIALSQDNTVSRRHARVSNNNGEFTIHDEGSSNGIFVNGVKVAEQVLKAGDEIQIGSTRLRFEA